MKKLLLAVSAVCITSLAQAGEEEIATSKWTHIENNFNVIDIYADEKNIKVDGKIVKFWMLHDFKKAVKWKTPQDATINVSSVTNQMEIHCVKGSARLAYQMFYTTPMGQGNGSGVDDKPQDWIPIIPGTYLDKVSRANCPKATKSKKG